jgi:hypothetical protein
MQALLLGAGFSRWAADLPLASQLFDFAVEPFGIREHDRLERVKEQKKRWDAMNPGRLAEQFIGSVLLSPDSRARKDLLWYIVRRLSEPYIWQEWQSRRVRRHVLMIDENRRWDRRGVRVAADFLARLTSQLSGIITLNYDLLVEYALGSAGFNYGDVGEILTGRGPYPVSQWRNPVRLVGRLPIAKLHGSISWDASGKYTDGRRGLTGDALIVAPAPEKHPPTEMEEQWELARRILSGATRILVFGFAFNPYDEAVLVLLRESGRGLREAAIVDISCHERHAKELWPDARVRHFQPPPQQAAELYTWLKEASL